MNVSDVDLRKQKYKDSLSFCDSQSQRERILIERIIQLENSLNDLSLSYSELLRKFELCVQVPF